MELKTYTGELLEIVGATDLEVSYLQQEPKTYLSKRSELMGEGGCILWGI